jgi:hypothetical protein
MGSSDGIRDTELSTNVGAVYEFAVRDASGKCGQTSARCLTKGETSIISRSSLLAIIYKVTFLILDNIDFII